MKQTAVNWLIEQISSSKYFYNLMEEIQSRSTIAEPNGILHKAKEMEKEQIIDAYAQGFIESETMDKGAKQYYNETFKNK
jgi:hypothetical protein